MIWDKLSLKGRVALVTGGNRGLGNAIATSLAEAGADVALVSGSGVGLQEASEALQRLGSRSLPIRADVARLSEVQRMVDETVAHFGRLDILVNAAGTQVRKWALDITEEDWDRLMAVNLKGLFFACQAAARQMIRQGKGKIINIASLTSVIGIPNISIYGGSKGGVAQITRALAVEWAPYHINVNGIGPGFFKTALTAPVFANAERVAAIEKRVPLGRTAVPEELGPTAVFLASEASDYITGQIVFVDGGYLAT